MARLLYCLANLLFFDILLYLYTYINLRLSLICCRFLEIYIYIYIYCFFGISLYFSKGITNFISSVLLKSFTGTLRDTIPIVLSAILLQIKLPFASAVF